MHKGREREERWGLYIAKQATMRARLSWDSVCCRLPHCVMIIQNDLFLIDLMCCQHAISQQNGHSKTGVMNLIPQPQESSSTIHILEDWIPNHCWNFYIDHGRFHEYPITISDFRTRNTRVHIWRERQSDRTGFQIIPVAVACSDLNGDLSVNPMNPGFTSDLSIVALYEMVQKSKWYALILEIQGKQLGMTGTQKCIFAKGQEPNSFTYQLHSGTEALGSSSPAMVCLIPSASMMIQ